MKTKIVYRSKTGHSRKIASALAESLSIEAIDLKKQTDIGTVDLLIIVGGIYAGQSNPDLVAFAKTLNPSHVKRAALVTSCASRKFFQKEVRAELIAQGIDVVTEEAVCWGSCLFHGWGHPNHEDFETASAFVRKLI